jgi:hypothetical protein
MRKEFLVSNGSDAAINDDENFLKLRNVDKSFRPFKMWRYIPLVEMKHDLYEQRKKK